MIPDRLNIGCGNDYREDWYNVDIGDCKKDAYMDVTKPLPFEDNTFKLVFAQHVLEHISRGSFFNVFREINRVLEKGGILDFTVPVAGSDNFWTDPTHTMPYTPRTMDFFIDGKQLRENGIIYGIDYSFEEINPPTFVDQVGSLKFLLRKK